MPNEFNFNFQPVDWSDAAQKGQELQQKLIDDILSGNSDLEPKIKVAVLKNQLFDYYKQQEAARKANKGRTVPSYTRQSFMENTANAVANPTEYTEEQRQAAITRVNDLRGQLNALNAKKNSRYVPQSAKEGIDDEIRYLSVSLDVAQKQQERIERDTARAKAYREYNESARAVEDARERGISYADQFKSYSEALKKLNEDRATLNQQLKDIRGGRAGFFGLENAEAQDQAEKEAQAELEKLERDIQRVEGQRNYAFGSFMKDTGSEQVIRQGEELAKTLKEQFLAGNMPDPTSNADYRAWVDSNPDKTARDYAEQLYADREPNGNWTQAEKDQYYALMTISPDSAYQFAVDINSAVNREQREEIVNRFGNLFSNFDMSREAMSDRSLAMNAVMGLGNIASDIAGIAGGVATGPVKLFNWLDNIYQTNARDGYYAGNSVPRISDYSDKILNQNAERLNGYASFRDDVPVLGGKGLGDLYQLVESVAQSMVYGNGLTKAFSTGATTVAGIEAAKQAAKLSTGLIFFGQAADSSYNEYIQRGMSHEQATVGSFFAGLAEAAGEEFSIDHLINGDIAEGLVKYATKQAIIESSEEGFTNVLNLFGDELAARLTGGESKMRQDIEVLKRRGMSEKDAKRQVWKEFVDETAFDMLGGLFSGGLSGGAQSLPVALANAASRPKAQTSTPAQNNAQAKTKPQAQRRNPLADALQGRTAQTAAQEAAGQQEAPAGQITQPNQQDDIVDVRIAVRDTVTPQESQIYNWGIKKDATLAPGRHLPNNGRPSTHSSSVASNPVSENSPTVEDNSSIDNVPQDQSGVKREAVNQTTAERTNGVDSRGYTGPLVYTQDRVFETQLTDEEKQIPGLTAEEARHIQHHDAEVDARAKARIAASAEQAWAELLAAESWSDEDTATAGYLIQAELEAAEKAGSVEERAKIYKRLAELKKQWNKQGTEEGRALRQRRRFVAEDIVSAAADILYGEKKNDTNEKALRKLNPQAKDAIMGKVREYAARFNDMQKNGGTVGDLIQLIKDVSVQRRTTGLFSRENGRAVDFALSEVAKQEGGVDFLKELATTQIKSVASDYIKPGIIDRLKSWRFMAMLSNPATTTANAGSNFIFGSFMEALSGNLALPFDILMSQVTGQREVAGELGAFSKTKWQGSYDAMLRSFLEVTLDAETAQADYGYKELKGGTFKMVGNPIERLLATMQKYQGYALKTTDQAAKGGAEAQVREGLGKLAERGKAKAENIDMLARQEAEYRTLQSKGKVSTAVYKVRSAVDEAFRVGNEKTGKYGLASDIMPFAQVPANAVAITLESNPAIGAAKALLETAKVLRDGKNAEPGQQAKAARAWGRVANGVAVTAMFAALAAKGYIRDDDDDDKDIATQRKAEGRSGVQFNISALLRGDPSERKDDIWIDFSWIPPLNGLANFGVDIYRAYTEDGHIGLKDITLASGDALASAFMDFPAVSKISSMIKTYQNSEAEGVVGKGLETIATGAAQTISSILVPNAVRSVAAGIDPYERDVYNTDTYGEGIRNNLIAGIPGLRQTLPERLDTFGQPVKNEGGVLHFLDKTLIPGNVSRHNRQSAASKYVEDLIVKTGNKKLQPDRNPPYNATLGDGENKQNVELTAAERRTFQRTRGNAIREMTEALAESGFFRGTTEEHKALFSAIKNAANHQAEAELAESRGIEHTPSQISGKDFMSFSEMGAPESVLDRLAENGMTGKGRNVLWDVLRGNGESPQNIASAAEQIDADGNGQASQADLYAYLRDKSNLTAEEKQRIWETYNPTGKTSYADYAAKNGGDVSKATKSSGNILYDYFSGLLKNAK